jgi:hypothetical protein
LETKKYELSVDTDPICMWHGRISLLLCYTINKTSQNSHRMLVQQRI